MDKAWRKFWIAFFATLVIMTALMLAIVIPAKQYAKKLESLTPITYTVEQGDTLWWIAQEYCPTSIHIDDYIAKVKKANNLTGFIQPGQTLIIFQM